MTPAVSTPTPQSGPVAAQAQVLFFGRVADAFGRRVTVSLPSRGCRVADLRRILAGRGAEAAVALARPDVRVAIDQSIVDAETWVRPGCEVAFFSMFSGG